MKHNLLLVFLILSATAKAELSTEAKITCVTKLEIVFPGQYTNTKILNDDDEPGETRTLVLKEKSLNLSIKEFLKQQPDGSMMGLGVAFFNKADIPESEKFEDDLGIGVGIVRTHDNRIRLSVDDVRISSNTRAAASMRMADNQSMRLEGSILLHPKDRSKIAENFVNFQADCEIK
jgi:hypothetical protein